ncbi:beta/gamma crystallin-related protein [Gottfriedia acidiceleris]|uniref:beta/gamma crystallin-related protein n=1 Tax=Bacillaceae TaxID=186817 RepID=UPI001596A2AB|nr:beta/gamma crystallin-related protein [Bacillus sp. AFS001701]
MNAIDDHSINDKASSIVVIGGNWRLYRNSGINISYAPVLGPGLYRFVGDWQIENDQISSLKPTNEIATVGVDHLDSLGQPADRQLTLFKEDNKHGDHSHVFAAEPNLNDPSDNSFNDNVRSIAVKGKRFWRIYLDSQFITPTNYMLGASIHSISDSYYSQFSLISSLLPDF